MLVQTEKSTAQRHYETEVASAFRHYVEATPPGTSNDEQAEARRHYVSHVHAIRRRWSDAFEHVGLQAPAWLPPVERPLDTLTERPAFEVVGVLVYDAATDSLS